MGLSVLELAPMYATGIQTSDVKQKHRLMARLLGAGYNKEDGNNGILSLTQTLYIYMHDFRLDTAHKSKIQVVRVLKFTM